MGDVLVIALILAAAGLAVRAMVKNKRAGKSCCGGCDGNCANCAMHNHE